MQSLATKYSSLKFNFLPYLPSHAGFKFGLIAYAFYSTQGLVTIISGPSMYPTLNSTPSTSRFHVPDLVWLQKNYNPNDLEVGDIVIFQSPLEKDFKYCKRIASLGDTFVYSTESPIPVYVPPGHFWALGDNPKNSFDSDQFGPISQSLIDGVITLRLHPYSREAVKRRVMTNEVRYQDPVMLLQRQFEQYQIEKAQSVSFFENPIQYIRNWFNSGLRNNKTTIQTINTNSHKDMRILNSEIDSTNNVNDDNKQSNISQHNGASQLHIPKFQPILQQPPLPSPQLLSNKTAPLSSQQFPDGYVALNEHGDYLTEEDLVFNRFQHQQAQQHLQLLLQESEQHKQIQQSLRHQHQREQFLRDAGKWHDQPDVHLSSTSSHFTPQQFHQSPTQIKNTFGSTPIAQMAQMTPAQQHQIAHMSANGVQLNMSQFQLQSIPASSSSLSLYQQRPQPSQQRIDVGSIKESSVDYGIDAQTGSYYTETYNPFTKRYGNTR